MYEAYHKNAYKKSDVTARVNQLMADTQVTNKRGIFEYMLGSETDKSLLNIRVFDKKTIASVYKAQTKEAEAKDESNCQMLCKTHNHAKGNK